MEYSRKKRLLIFGGISLLIALFIVAFLVLQNPNPEEEAYEYTDEDTGEVISVQPGVTPESFNEGGEDVLVIGLSALGTYGSVSLTDDQLPVFRKDLAENGIKKLSGHDKTVKIINPRLNEISYDLEADLIYKEGETPARLVFDNPGSYSFTYKILLNNNSVYQSKKLDIDNKTQPDFNSIGD